MGVIREQALRDLEVIKTITGEPDVRYHDIAFLKEKMKGILLQREPKNIQMLTCFTLQNVFRGLMILTAEIFGQEVDLKTLIVHKSKEDKFTLDESQGY